MSKVTFSNSHPTFFPSLKDAVDAYFDTHQLSRTGNWKLYLKAEILVPLAMAIYLFLLLGSYSTLAGLALCIVLGLILVSIAFNVMHDACHGSYSKKKWVNDLMGLTMNALGSNAFIWKIKHNVIHHTYTNVDGLDDDIANGPFLRHCATQRWRPLHRYQFIYMFFLYAISTLVWMFVFDFAKYFARKIHTTPIKTINTKEHILFWLSKALYVFFYALVPIYFLGWQAWLIGFLMLHVIMGLVLSIVFQLAHVVEKTSFESVGDTPKLIESEWAVHEVMTTADFAPGNKVISWFVGGLNYQVEHHLFPRICHIHYPALSKIVREQCMRFHLPYHSYSGMGQAIISHVRVMKQLGKRPCPLQQPPAVY
jgi:linoleoyl-CoA desaturase